MDFVYFIVLVGALIFVHELGHFACAKLFGVKVLKFSLGFGPRIAGFTRGDTEYVIAALPLGGYVRMLGENPLDDIAPQDRLRAFPYQPLLRRILIVVAGPAMNLLLPIALYFVVFLGDTTSTPAVVGTVLPGRPAEGQLEPGDRVLAIDGDPVETFYDMARRVERSAGKPLSFLVERRGEPIEKVVTPVLAVEERPLDRRREVGRIGVMPHHPLAAIGVPSPTSPAGAARLRTFDMVISAGGQPVERWSDLAEILERNRGTTLPLTYLRPQPVADALGGLVELDVYEPRVAALTPAPGQESGLARAGIEPVDLYVSRVTPDSPEHAMGLQPGDRLVALEGAPLRAWSAFLDQLASGRGKAHALMWQRDGEVHEGLLSLQHRRGVSEHGLVYDRYVVGVRNWVPMRPAPPVPNPSLLRYAAREAVSATSEVVELTVLSVVRLFQGQLTVKSLGGPLTIFDVAGTAAREGMGHFLTLMAFISINLGLLNLLPIPLLDGGHLMFLVIEAVVRRPLSLRVREYASIVGLAVLIILMTLAFKNDIERQWPHLMDGIGGG